MAVGARLAVWIGLSVASFGGANREWAGLAVKKDREDDKDQLAGDENEQPFESSFHEAVVVQPHPQQIHAEPGKGCDDISENGQHRHAELSYQAAKARVQNHRAPEHDHQRTVFFRVPTPEATP